MIDKKNNPAFSVYLIFVRSITIIKFFYYNRADFTNFVTITFANGNLFNNTTRNDRSLSVPVQSDRIYRECQP